MTETFFRLRVVVLLFCSVGLMVFSCGFAAAGTFAPFPPGCNESEILEADGDFLLDACAENSTDDPHLSLSAGETGIIAPAVIDRPGRYRLTNDLVNASAETAIWIRSSDVILDGCGHTLGGGLNLNSWGVLVGNVSGQPDNITVTNLTVTGWAYGVQVEGATGTTLCEIRAAGDKTGIDIGGSPGTTVIDCIAVDNIPLRVQGVFYGGIGLSIYDSPQSRILDSNISRNSRSGNQPFVGGYGLISRNNTGLSISGCVIDGNFNTGIWNELSKNTTVIGNHIRDNEGNGGVFMAADADNPVMDCTIADNTISGSGWGIWLINDDYLVQNNTVTGCGYGILLDTARNATLTANVMSGNEMNFGVMGNSNEYYNHQVDITNTVDGRPIYYLVDQTGAVVDGASGAGTVYGIACDNLTIRDLTLEKNVYGVFLLASDGAVIENVTANESERGFYILQSDGIRIDGCSARENTLNGFEIQDSDDVRLTASEAALNSGHLTGTGIYAEKCRGIIVQQANVSQNNYAGIELHGTDTVWVVNVTADANAAAGMILEGDTIYVTGCALRDNPGPGIGMLDSANVTIWNNYFLNAMNVDLSAGVVTNASWNAEKTAGTNIVNGPFLGGNYWATPDGTGWSQVTPDRGDGFCTDPYVLDGNNTDFLPLHFPVPSANFTAYPTWGTAPLTVTFTDHSSGVITAWLWDFGDGTSTATQNATHTYATAGTFTVNLTVAGPYGNDSALANVTVNAPSGGGGGGSSVSTATSTGSAALLTASWGGVLKPYRVYSDETDANLYIATGVTALIDGAPLGEIGIADLGSGDVPAVPTGAVFTFLDHAVECSPAGATFSPAIDLTFTLSEEEWAAAIEKAGENAGSLVVKWYDPVSGVWEDVPTIVDAVHRTLTASITHFSTYGLFADPSVATPVTQEPENPATTVAVVTTVPAATTPSDGDDLSWLWIAALVAIIVIAAGAYFLTRR